MSRLWAALRRALATDPRVYAEINAATDAAGHWEKTK